MIFRELDLIRVKGKQQPVTIYEVFSADASANGGKELAELFGRAREAYKLQDWRSGEISI